MYIYIYAYIHTYIYIYIHLFIWHCLSQMNLRFLETKAWLVLSVSDASKIEQERDAATVFQMPASEGLKIPMMKRPRSRTFSRGGPLAPALVCTLLGKLHPAR